MKDKYEFISDLIQEKNLKQSQKEKVLGFALQEMQKEGLKNEEILKRLEEIERKVNTEKTEIIDLDEGGVGDDLEKKDTEKSENEIEKANQKKEKFIPPPNPKHVADFMSLFNQRDGFKYLTHDFDENTDFEIDKFLITAKEIFDEVTNKLNIPTSLWRIVEQFAFNSKQTDWSSISEDYKSPIQVKIGWATKELRDWSKQNRLHPIRNGEYEKMINKFKQITRIETPNLEKLINSTLEKSLRDELSEFIIEKKELSKADFYSHVTFLKTALEIIFEEIKKRSDSPEKKEIIIKYERDTSDDYYLRKIVITHCKSFPIKELNLILKEWQQKGNMGRIKKILKGYCHWSVETIIEEKPMRVNILKEKNAPECEIIKHKPEGFTHILTFYYK